MKRGRKVLLASVISGVLMVASPAVAGTGTSEASNCDTDPGGVRCLLDRVTECGPIFPLDPPGPAPEAAICKVEVLLDWTCPSGGPCNDALGYVAARCEELQVCDIVFIVLDFVLDTLPPLVCVDKLCT